MTTKVIVVCAWCKLVIKKPENADFEKDKISHGICENCEKIELSKL